MQSPTSAHFTAALRVLRYLKQSLGQDILLSSQSTPTLTAYSDSDWGRCVDFRKSVTGYCVLLGNSPISWRTKMQSMVARSTAEAEFKAIATTTCEVTWLLQLFIDLGLSQLAPAQLKCDNQAALYIVSNPVFHECTEHIEVDCHLIHDKMHCGVIKPTYVPTKAQLADVCTKIVTVCQHNFLLSKLGVHDIFTSQFEGECRKQRESAESVIISTS